MHHFRFFAAVSVIAIAQSASAAAATETGTAAIDTTNVEPESGAVVQPDDGSASDAGLTEIIVTATKKETDLQKTPIAISVVDQQLIQDRHIQSLIDLADGGVPSLRVATFEARQSALTIGIRGIVPFDQNQVAREPGVGVYIDGVYLGRSQGLNAALFDVQRIEVLRGPQGTLFGRNTEGGALSIVSKAPTGEFGGRVSTGIGNYGTYDGQIHVDLPAIANFAVKIDGVMQHQGATTSNPASGQYGWNYYNRIGGRIAGRWTPTSDLTVDLSYDRAKDENTPFYSQLLNYNPLGLAVGTYKNPATSATGTTLFNNGVACNGTNNRCIAPLAPIVRVEGSDRMKSADLGVIQQPSVDETQGYTAALTYALGPQLDLRSITAWRGVETRQWDGSAGAHRSAFVPNGQFGRYSLSELFQHQFSQEIQLVGSLPQVDFVFGGHYFVEHVREAAATPNPMQWNADGSGYTFINQVAPNPNAPISSSNQGWDRPDWYVQRDSQAVGKSYGVFGQATWTPAGFDIVHLTAGGRYTHETRVGALTVINNAPLPGATLDYKNNRFDPMVTLAVDAARGVNLYAKYSTGFRAGGANSRSSSFRQFNPESVKAYEIGAKTDLLDHRVRLNLAAYIMDRRNTQIDFDFVDTRPTLAGGVANPFFNRHTEETVNVAGTSRIKGLEAELTVQPVEGLTFGASYAYTDVNVPPVANPIKESPATFGIITQVSTVYTPKNAASGYVDFAMPVNESDMRLRFHIDGNYADPQFSFQSENVLTDSSFIVNGSITLADIPLTDSGVRGKLSLWSRNLFNEAHIYRRSAANASLIGDYGNFNPPRTFGVEGTVSF